MKKKGLIVATIVMVLVLAVSLTTATYAWFTQANVTTVDGFGIEVAATAAVNIGLKMDNTHDPDASADAFVSGTVTWNSSANGVVGSAAGSWGGDPGLSPTLDHNISFGKVSRAVGVTTVDAANITTDTTENNTKGFAAVSGDPAWAGYTADTVIIGAQKGKNGALAAQELAVCNLQTTGNSDFAYLFLGAMPTKMLTEANELIILVQSTGDGTTIGIAAAVHVAYRLNGGEWKDIDVFGNVHYTASKATTSVSLDKEEAAGFDGSANAKTVSGAAVHKITLTADGKNAENEYAEELDQIELIIYLAGWDSDCIDAAKGAVGTVSIFFDAKTVAEG